MRTSVTILFLMLLVTSVAAQAPDTLWTRTYGGSSDDFAYSVQQTTDGGYVVAGYTGSFVESDIYLVKTSSSGDTLWTRSYGGNGNDYAHSVQQTTDGGYVVAGGTESFGAGSEDFYLMKTNGLGDTLWTCTYGGSSGDHAWSVQQTADGGYVLAGTTLSFGAGSFDFFLVKTDANGDTLWTRTYGGSAYDQAYSVQQTSDGGYVVAGHTESFGAGLTDVYLVKTNGQGDTLWTRTYGGGNRDNGNSIQQTTDGGYVLAGTTMSFGAGLLDFYLVKTDANGDTLWTRTYGGSSSDGASSVQQTTDGGYVVAGYTESFGAGRRDFFLVRTNGSGDMLWSRTYGGSENDCVSSVRQTSDGGYVLAGHTYSFGVGYADFYVVKTGPERYISVRCPNGNEEWQLFRYDTVRWQSYDYEGPVKIELNRDYPGCNWEVLAESTENDGEEVVWVTDPLSDHCRVRISALEDTLSDISDGDFSIVSSQGYLALARQSSPTSPVLSWNAGTVECPSSFTETFRLKNFGSEAIVVFQPLEPASDEFSRATSCGSYFALAPSQMGTCSLTLTFDPEADGTYLDTLLIQTDAVNGVNGYVRIPLSGTQISTPAAPEIVIQPSGNDVVLSWNHVTESIGACPVTVTGYLVFFSEVYEGPYWFHGGTTDTSYVHPWVIPNAEGMYYHVIATTAELSLMHSLPVGGVLTETETIARLRKGRFATQNR